MQAVKRFINRLRSKSPWLLHFDCGSCNGCDIEILACLTPLYDVEDYSGPFLALTEIGHWFEVVLLLGVCTLFWTTSWIGMAILLAVTYFLEVLVDNTTSRMNWRWMLSYVWGVGLTLSLVNLIWLQRG